MYFLFRINKALATGIRIRKYLKRDFLFMYVIQHCFICRPADSTLSEDAGIEPRTVTTLALTIATLALTDCDFGIDRLRLCIDRSDAALDPYISQGSRAKVYDPYSPRLPNTGTRSWCAGTEGGWR